MPEELTAKDGTPLTPEVLEQLAAEAEAGYDLSTARRRRVGRPPLDEEGEGRRMTVRVTDEAHRLLSELATAQGRKTSEVVREALNFYLRQAKHEPQTAAELAAHFGPAGPVVAARHWMDLVSARKTMEAWAMLDERLRLDAARDWVSVNREHRSLRNRDLDQLTAALARGDQQDALWKAFSKMQLAAMRTMIRGYRRWGVASRPRVLAPDVETLIFMETPKGRVLQFDEPTLIQPDLIVNLRSTDEGWRVAGWWDRLPDDPANGPTGPDVFDPAPGAAARLYAPQ